MEVVRGESSPFATHHIKSHGKGVRLWRNYSYVKLFHWIIIIVGFEHETSESSIAIVKIMLVDEIHPQVLLSQYIIWLDFLD